MSKLKEYIKALKDKAGVTDMQEKITQEADRKALERGKKIMQSPVWNERQAIQDMKVVGGELPEGASKAVEQNQKKALKEIVKSYGSKGMQPMGSRPLMDLGFEERKIADAVRKETFDAQVDAAKAKLAKQGEEMAAKEAQFLSKMGKAAQVLGPALTAYDFLFNTPPVHTDAQEQEELRKYRENQK